MCNCSKNNQRFHYSSASFEEIACKVPSENSTDIDYRWCEILQNLVNAWYLMSCKYHLGGFLGSVMCHTDRFPRVLR